MEKSQYEELRIFQDKHWWFKGKKEIVLDFSRDYLKKSKGGNILDIGSGMGLMTEVLSQHGSVYGLDMEEDAVKYCTEKYEKKGIKFIQGALPNDVDFPDNTFDMVYALDILEHIEDDLAGAKKICNLLRKDGRLVLTVPARMDMWGYNDVINHHYRRYYKKELVEVLNKAGFSVERCSYYNSFLFPIAYIVRRIKNRFMIEKKDVEDVGNLINTILYRIFSAEKYWLRKHNFKTGVSLIVLARKK